MSYFNLSDTRTVTKLVFLGLILRVFVAVWDGFFGPSYGAGADASTYHNIAVDYVYYMAFHGFRFYQMFPYALGVAYQLMFKSLFLGCLFSCAAWTISAFVLVKILRLLSVTVKYQCIAMLLYALLPSSILFTSITLKEAYELLMVNLAVYSALKILMSRAHIYWFLLLGSVVIAGILHVTFYVSGLAIVVITAVAGLFRRGEKISFIKIGLVVSALVLVLYAGSRCFTTVTNYKMHHGLAAALESFVRGGLLYLDVGRAFYRTSVDINGIAGLLQYIPVSLFQYLFEPMPWRISAIVDMQAVLENILRLCLICMALAGLRKLPVGRRALVVFIIFSYILIETVWAVGTLNWGTAIRHHIPAMGLLIAAAFSSFAAYSHGQKYDDMVRRNQRLMVKLLAILSIILLVLSVRAYYWLKLDFFQRQLRSSELWRQQQGETIVFMTKENAELKSDLNNLQGKLGELESKKKRGRKKINDIHGTTR